MKVYLNKEYKCVKVEDNTFVANDSSNYIRYYFVTNANGDVIDKMDDTSVIYRNTEPSYVTVAFRRADGDVIQHLMASPKTDTTGKSFFEYEITNTDGVLYKKGALEISAQFIEATLSETGGVKKVISQKVKAIAINTAHVLDNIGEEAEEYYSQYEQANNDAHAVLQAQITTNFNNIGTLQELTTDAKDDLVKAINEVDAHADANKAEIGDLSTLTTDEKTTIVGAINEVDQHADDNKAEIGTLNALTTDEKATLVGAINEVDNHADNATVLANNAVATANSAVATANEAKTTAQTAENNANSALDTANAANATAGEAKAIAQGSQRAIGFATLQAAITALNGYSNTQLKVGDNVYIVETGVPDLWVAAVEQNSVAYNYTTNDAFNDDLVENTLVQVGYYKFAYLESDGKPCTVAWQNMTVAASDWVASTEFEDFAYEAKITLTDFVNFSSIPQVVFGLTEATSGNYAPICKAGDKGVYIYSKVNTAITLPTVVTFAPNVHGASMQGGGYTNKGKWVASTTYAIDDLVYTDNGQFVCIEGITSTTSPEQDTQHWQATFVATGKTKNGLTISGQDNGTEVQKTFDGSTPVEVAFDEQTMTVKEVNGVLEVGAKGTIPEALPQTASALKSGNLPTSGWASGWIQNTLPARREWESVTYGDGKFVAVAASSQYGAYSTDGINWTEMIMPANRGWYSVTYGNGKFVAVASSSNKGAYSTDGINWTEFTLPTSTNWTSVTYGGGKFVAVAESRLGAYSTDGITWTKMDMPEYNEWESVTYGDGKFVVVERGGLGKGAYSTNGITWTETTLPASGYIIVVYGDGKFVAVTGNSAEGAYSTDGINWTEMTLLARRGWVDVAYGDGKFVAVAADSSAGAYSTDGINWTEMTMPASSSWESVTYGDGKFVVVTWDSTDGTYWKVDGRPTYTISDTSITANSDVLMELTDDGGVKAQALESGKITVIRDTVPTQPIPYTYKVKQTNASGQFTLVNHYVPAYTKIESTIATTDWADSAPSWIGQNALTWSKLDNEYYIQGGTEDLGLVVGGSYTTTVTIDGTDYEQDEAEVFNEHGQVMYQASFNKNAVLMQIYDHCTGLDEQEGLVSGNGYVVSVLVNSDTVPSSIVIKSCSAVSGGGVKATISNSAIKTNSAVTMYIDYDGKISVAKKIDGSLTVSAKTTPTVNIPYSIEIIDTNTEGLFEIINAYVPNVPVESVNGQTGAVTIAVPTKTSDLQNDSNFAKTTEANTFTGVQTFSNADGIKTDRVHNLDNNDAWYNFDGANNRFGSPSRPTIIRTSEARPRAQVPSGETTVTKEIALLEDVQGVGEWSDIVQSATITEQGTYYVLTNRDAITQVAGNPSIVYWDGSKAAHGTKYVYSTVVDGVFTIYEFWAIIDNSGTMTACYNSAKCENGVWTRVKSEEPVGFQYKKITN